MNAYLLVTLVVMAGAVLILWVFRPRKCKGCNGTGKRLCHDGAEADFHYADCPQCQGTGWKV
jgi:hypothetical protein